MKAVEPRRDNPRNPLLPGLAALAAFLVLVGLGTWQLQRKAWKDGLIATLSERLAAPPLPLPDRAQWPELDRDRFEFTRVRFPAEFVHDREALVYSVGSTLRTGAPTGPGYLVFTPARLTGGGFVLVNRGFVSVHCAIRRAAPQVRRGTGRNHRRHALAGSAVGLHTRRGADPEPVVRPRPRGDRRRQEHRSGAILYRTRSADACRRIAPAGAPSADPAEQPPAICDHVVRPRRRPPWRVRDLGRPTFQSADRLIRDGKAQGKPVSIIAQQPLDIFELELRPQRIGEAPAQLFQDASRALNVDLAGHFD